ncbi:MAG: hypothetical protein ACRDRV_07135 [Pseudonocardiaceae bacterium]
MKEVWLVQKPTHTGGVLKDLLGVEEVITNETIASNILRKPDQDEKEDQHGLGSDVDKVMTNFVHAAKSIVQRLEQILKEIPGTTVADKSHYFTNNSTR